MVKKVTQAKKVEVEQAEEKEVQEQPKASNVKKLVKKETPAPAPKETKVKKEKAAPKEEDPNQVTLKQICDQHSLNPTTARVKLRRKFGAKGVRYSWEKDSDELGEIVTLLTTKAEKAEAEPKAKAAPKKKSKKAAEPEVVDDEGGDEDEDEESEEAEIE
jgi:hypothetical protein